MLRHLARATANHRVATQTASSATSAVRDCMHLSAYQSPEHNVLKLDSNETMTGSNRSDNHCKMLHFFIQTADYLLQ